MTIYIPPPTNPNESIFCTECGIHLATAMHPTCPVCDDIAAKESKR